MNINLTTVLNPVFAIVNAETIFVYVYVAKTNARFLRHSVLFVDNALITLAMEVM